MTGIYKTVPIKSCVVVEGFNARTKGLGDIQELTESIKVRGVLQPLLGKSLENDKQEIEIYAGFRRLAAAEKAGLTLVPVIVTSFTTITQVQMLLINVAENIPRENLNPVDEALRYDELQKEHGQSIDQICGELGVKKTRVEKRLRLLKLNLAIREAVHADQISIRAALKIDTLPKDLQDKYVKIALCLRGVKLDAKIEKELERIQLQADGTEKPEKKGDPAGAKENIKRIKKANKILCTGLGYGATDADNVRAIKYSPLDDDDLRTLAKLLDDCADNVDEDIPVNKKAEEEIAKWAECNKKNMVLDSTRVIVQRGIYAAVIARASDIAVEKSEGGKPKVTYDTALEALNEFFGEAGSTEGTQ